MKITRIPVTLAATTGDITAQSVGPLSGEIRSVHIQYASATDTGFATTAVLLLKTNTTQQTVWSETLTTLATTTVTINRLPRQVAHTNLGVALTATESLRREPFAVDNELLNITCTSVGSGTKSATLHIVMG